MAILHPFEAVRPQPAHVEEVASVPYDVVSVEEARTLAEGKPRSFLHVIRPEIDLPPGTDEHEDAVYAQGAKNMQAFLEADYTERESTPALYVYRLVMDGRTQTGIFGCVSVAEYDDDTILKHEKTRPAKEDDRTRHVLEQEAHAEPVMLTYRDEEAVGTLVDAAQEDDPLYDFTADDGVRHTLWRVEATPDLADAFQAVAQLYVADGHHRCKAASRAAHELGSDEAIRRENAPEYAYFPAVLFPMSEMHIMAYNRVVRELPTDASSFLDRLDEQFDLERDVSDAEPDMKGTVCVYADGAWHRLTLPPSRGVRLVDQLDVSRLSEYVLEPMLAIRDPRRDPNIDFVGGIRGTDALENRVDDGDAAVAFSMFPTQIEELVGVSDEGDLMPPKSTWFEPKLRSGLLVHPFDPDEAA
jgi:uncharacterized protein (DUF1015 family)